MMIQEFSVGNKSLIIEDTKIFWEGKLFYEEIIHPTEIRYGYSPIEVDMLTIGTNSKIQLRNEKKTKFDISIKTYLGIKKSKKTISIIKFVIQFGMCFSSKKMKL